ncbi:hypothetical protein FACS1894211_15100 [Clostridia bacterium]|nr:hypothetical protein FACS1894211_15100 [Clostridia bacterium]
MKEAREIIERYFAEYAVCPAEDGGAVVLTKTAYTPYGDPGEGYFLIDAYYPAANEAYHKTVRLIADLNAAGIAAERYAKFGFKELAVRGGLADRVYRNTLAYSGRDGSRFALSGLCVAGFGQPLPPRPGPADTAEPPGRQNTACGDCGQCVRACPTGAISATGFDRAKCLRQYMADGAFPDERAARAAGRRLWGCDLCQACCPANSDKTTPMPAELRELLKIEGFVENISARVKGLIPWIGANYAKPEKLKRLAEQLLKGRDL